MNTELIALLANIALTLSVIVAVIFGIVQVRTSNRDRHERLTLETLRNFQTKEFAQLLLFYTNTSFPDSYDKYRTWPNEDQVNFIQLMQQMETLGILLAGKFIDFDLVDKTLGVFVVNSWEKYKPAVLDFRITLDDPYMAEYFQWMSENIDRKMKEIHRIPYHQIAKEIK
jgi:hypothetical protein